MLPDVEKYFQALKDADAAEESESAEARAIYVQQGYSNEYTQKREAASEKLAAAKKTAWQNLSTSTDPVVAWIGKNVQVYHREEAKQVLKLLPLTLVQLDELARREEWCEAYWGCDCGDFDEAHNKGYRHQMIEAGLFPTTTEHEKAATEASV